MALITYIVKNTEKTLLVKVFLLNILENMLLTLSEASAADSFLKTCFQLYSIMVFSFKGSFQVCFQSGLLQICCMRERVKEIISPIVKMLSKGIC